MEAASPEGSVCVIVRLCRLYHSLGCILGDAGRHHGGGLTFSPKPPLLLLLYTMSTYSLAQSKPIVSWLHAIKQLSKPDAFQWSNNRVTLTVTVLTEGSLAFFLTFFLF